MNSMPHSVFCLLEKTGCTEKLDEQAEGPGVQKIINLAKSKEFYSDDSGLRSRAIRQNINTSLTGPWDCPSGCIFSFSSIQLLKWLRASKKNKMAHLYHNFISSPPKKNKGWGSDD